jgi:hypothetical protein
MVGKVFFLSEQFSAHRAVEQQRKVTVYIGHGHPQVSRHLEQFVTGDRAAYVMGQCAKFRASGVDVMGQSQFKCHVTYAVDVGLQAVGQRMQAVLHALEQLGH